MNYGRVVSSAFSWVSSAKALWILVFFWLALPILVFLPPAIGKGVYAQSVLPVVFLLYAVLYFSLFLAVIFLIRFSLKHKHAIVYDFSARKIGGLIVLVALELFHVFVWGVVASLRAVQLLLIILSVFLFYSYFVSQSGVILWLFSFAAAAYCILAFYNFMRLFFCTTLFCTKRVSPFNAIDDAIDLTKNRAFKVFSAAVLSFVLAAVLFSFLLLCLGTVASLVLNYFFINPVALYLGFRAAAIFALAPAIVVYHAALAEVFAQLSAHREASFTVKHLLARRVLHPARRVSAKRAPARKLAKRKKRRR